MGSNAPLGPLFATRLRLSYDERQVRAVRAGRWCWLAAQAKPHHEGIVVEGLGWLHHPSGRWQPGRLSTAHHIHPVGSGEHPVRYVVEGTAQVGRPVKLTAGIKGGRKAVVAITLVTANQAEPADRRLDRTWYRQIV